MRPYVAIMIVVAAACGKRPTPKVRDDAKPIDAVVADANDLKERLTNLAPPYPPPPPIVRKHRRGDCKMEYAPRPDRDPNPMCLVKGGTFTMGGDPPSPPRKQVTVGDFYIDQFEVTIEQAVLFMNAHGNQCPGLDKVEGRIGGPQCVLDLGRYSGFIQRGGRFEVAPGWAHVAARSFSMEGAVRYCEWAGKQVSSSAQWEYAGRHDPETNHDALYPWGDEWEPDRAACSNCKQQDPPSTPPKVGTYDGTNNVLDGSSPWGLHDTVGNAPELLFECNSPDETCHAGQKCDCTALEVFPDRSDVAELALPVRQPVYLNAAIGIRCARPKR